MDEEAGRGHATARAASLRTSASDAARGTAHSTVEPGEIQLYYLIMEVQSLEH